MITEIRDPQFASFVEEIADSIRWPDASFAFTPWQAVKDVVVAVYEALATPDPATLRHALRGIAF